MEAAMKKKEEAAAAATATTTETNKKKKATAPPPQQKQVADIPKVPDTLVGEEEGGNDDDEVMYGAPDDVVWSDKSNAQRQAEEAGNEDPNKVRCKEIQKKYYTCTTVCMIRRRLGKICSVDRILSTKNRLEVRTASFYHDANQEPVLNKYIFLHYCSR